MASNLPAIEAAIEEAVKPGFRGDLLARGQARSMIWAQGEIPEDAPRFSSVLTYDLLAYGYSLLGYGLRVLEEKGDGAIARAAFEHAASAIESVVAKGKKVPSRDFHRLVAAAGFHLGQFSARAYSLLHKSFADANLTVSEQCLGLLMLRDMQGLDARIQGWRLAGLSSDASLVSLLESMKPEEDGDGASIETESNREFRDVVDVVVLALSDKYVSSMALATLALERGDTGLIEQAIVGFRTGLDGSADLNLVPQWWCFRLTIYLLGELWESSFHRRLPVSSAGIVPADWERLRRIFIASLYRREKSEFELWPSQLDAAQRALDLADNMVVSLPTSAGKTRVAELCILGCLAAGRKVVFVTPLRALSAQSETTLRRTFTPLGKTVSSLYGSIGVSEVDENVLNRCDIIVATPEKLDFALRSDPDLLNDVGLVVLDEGHMIGLGEREVRYEVQIQRLLKRSDADERRIICLSAVLPSGTELEDFVAWLTHDSPDGLLQKDWRPTRLRFGEVDWKGQHGQLNIQVGDEEPFVPRFVSAITPTKLKRKEAVPRNQRELCLATAWRLVEDDQSVLIFCPERRSVEPFAAAIVDLNKRGVLRSVLSGESEVLYAALTIGAEWLGPDHDLLRCLKLGVAIHHGALPSPFRKEVERLLQAGVLRVTVSSPTLAQGLNLSASTLIMFGIERNGEVIKSSEFRNIVGRAGRAYVDLEGVILYPMFDEHAKRRRQWKKLVKDDAGREMESGLLRLLVTLLARMNKKLKPASVAGLSEYVLNNINAWSFPELPGDSARVRALEEQKWHKYLTSLDTAILSLLGQEDVADEDIEDRLDAILGSSLFARRLLRQEKSRHVVIVKALAARTRYVWARTTATQRRGYFPGGSRL
jgi:superfamily II DNA/RNA helicase